MQRNGWDAVKATHDLRNQWPTLAEWNQSFTDHLRIQ